MTDFSAKPVLTGDRVVLRPADGADAPRLQQLMADPEVGRLTGSVHSSEPVDPGGPARDQGLGTEATRLAVAHACDGLDLHRVQLEVYAFNPRARRVYEKVGFVLEGTQREALFFDGAWVDCHVMGILEQDWRTTHRG